MPRRTYRRRYARVARPLKTVKYSNETFNAGNDYQKYITPAQGAINVPTESIGLIGAIAAQGMRKVKNFTLNLMTNSEVTLIWALIYLPDGGQIGNLNVGVAPNSASLYEPNQNVIMSGLLKSDSAQQTFRTRLARNLNSGDSVGLIFKQVLPYPQGTQPGHYTFFVNLNYAITY